LDLLEQARQQKLPRVDAQLILLHACQRPLHDRAWLLAHDQEQATAEQLTRWQIALQRRLQGEPVAYITGRKAFYGLELNVNASVLDPRDDTETLVDWALTLIPPQQEFRVLDLGTGSGAVALAIQSERPSAQVTATEASGQALELARSNAAAHSLAVRFVQTDADQSNWFHALSDEQFDLIVSNPPYIAEGDAHLAALKHEPAMALTSGADGLHAIGNIIMHAHRHLSHGGWLLLEHGHDQARRVQEKMRACGFSCITSRQDLAGIQRCTGGQYAALPKRA
jgi:release factor glutamine methyltransferase